MTHDSKNQTETMESKFENIQHVLDSLVTLTKGYATTLRSSIQFSRVKGKEVSDFNDPEIRESLLEHVGHLPIVAVEIFQYTDLPISVLGEALIMLSIHDIGEISTGDIMLFQKSSDEAKAEEQVALNMLSEKYKNLYLDMEHQLTDAGRFAKAIDKLVADILELLLDPEITKQRYKQQAGLEPHEIVNAKREKKSKYMEWNPYLKELYKELLERLENHLMSN